MRQKTSLVETNNFDRPKSRVLWPVSSCGRYLHTEKKWPITVSLPYVRNGRTDCLASTNTARKVEGYKKKIFLHVGGRCSHLKPILQTCHNFLSQPNRRSRCNTRLVWSQSIVTKIKYNFHDETLLIRTIFYTMLSV